MAEDNTYWEKYWRIADLANECHAKRITYPLSSPEAKQLDKIKDKIHFMFSEYGYYMFEVQTKFTDSQFESDIAKYREMFNSFPDGPRKGTTTPKFNGLLLMNIDKIKDYLGREYHITHDEEYDPTIDGKKILNFDYYHTRFKPTFVGQMLEELFLNPQKFYVYTELGNAVQLQIKDTLEMMKREFDFSLSDSKYYTKYDGSAP